MELLRKSTTLAAVLLALALPALAYNDGDLDGSSKPPAKHVMGYFENSGSNHSLTSFYKYFDQLPTDTFNTDIHGVVSGAAPSGALDFARSKNMLTFATVSNFGATDFDPKIAHAVLTQTGPRKKALQGMLQIVRANGYSGINLDYESVPHKDRAAYTAFVAALAKEMRAAGYLTVVSVPAELKDDPNNSWTGAFNFKAIGQTADIIQLMTYDENGPWGPPGPVAGKDWTELCIQFAVSVIPSAKISMGLPIYGYDWNLTKGTGAQVAWKDIPALIASTGAIPQWDATSSSPYFNYAKSGESHVVWYENSVSIPLKSAFAVTYNLAGVSVFALGFDDLNYWKAVHAGGF